MDIYDAGFFAFALLLAYLFIKKKDAYLGLFIAALFVFLLKLFYAVPRPCVGLDFCPESFSFPSGHSTIASVLLLSSIGLPSFFPFLLFAILVMAERIIIGVHYPFDVFGGIAIAAISLEISKLMINLFYAYKRKDSIASIFLKKLNSLKKDLTKLPIIFLSKIMPSEVLRQIIHALAGIFFIAILFIFGPVKLAYGLALGVFIALIVIHLLAINYRFPFSWFLEYIFSRNELVGYASLLYILGILFAVVSISNVNLVASIIWALGIGDAASNLIGSKYGRIKIFGRSLEGSLAFFLATLPVYFFIGPYAIPFALLSALIELFSFIDDNLLIPFLLSIAVEIRHYII